MEWTGRQQLYFLLQSVVLGAAQGLLLDVIALFRRPGCHRYWRFSDMAFGPLAAVITFLGSLVIMDGHLHPVLFFGVMIGMLTEHYMLGIWIRRFLLRLFIFMRTYFAFCVNLLVQSWAGLKDLLNFSAKKIENKQKL